MYPYIISFGFSIFIALFYFFILVRNQKRSQTVSRSIKIIKKILMCFYLILLFFTFVIYLPMMIDLYGIGFIFAYIPLWLGFSNLSVTILTIIVISFHTLCLSSLTIGIAYLCFRFVYLPIKNRKRKETV